MRTTSWVDISHESLIRQWDTLKAWVDEERESRNQFLDLVHRGHGYRQGERSLMQEPELQTAIRLASEAPTNRGLGKAL